MHLGTIAVALTRRSMARHLMKFIMIHFRRMRVLDTNRARDGRAVRHVPLLTHRSPTKVALTFALI